MSRGRSSRRARAKGKNGERNAKTLLQRNDWMVASTEVQGLAGDDIFAQSPSDRWVSLEVKNTNSFNGPKFIGQAKAQALERLGAIQSILALGGKEAELLEFLGMDKYTKNDWAVLWHPNNCGCSADYWVVAYPNKSGNVQIVDFASWERMMHE